MIYDYVVRIKQQSYPCETMKEVIGILSLFNCLTIEKRMSNDIMVFSLTRTSESSLPDIK